MSVAQLTVADATTSPQAGSARIFIKHEDAGRPSSGHFSDGGGLLSRRSRVRRRSTRRDDEESSDVFSTSDDISSGQLFVKIPPAGSPPGQSPQSSASVDPTAPPRPERSPNRPSPAGDLPLLGVDEQRRGTRLRTLSSGAAPRPELVDERGRETCSESGHHRRGLRPRGLSLPRHAFRNGSLSDSSEQPSPLTPLAFHDIPPIPVFAPNRRYRHKAQDSQVTQQSSASSSLYPKSTSTDESFPSLPSLPSNDIDDRRLIINVDPEINPHIEELHEMDADDVSYRLRLLMRNNYYLPPAHSKPFADMASLDAPKKSPKAPSPTFFDIFKVGKKKAADPKPNVTATAPILRTTSDSSTLSGLIRPDRPPKPIPYASAATPPRQEGKKGRVVVVRERMEDIDVVAKQVEQDLKVREAERRRVASESSDSGVNFDQFVDPTDAVDLPPTSTNNLLGPRASLLGGTTYGVGADAGNLADGLHPSSPGISSFDSEEAAWRKALLHAAVDHSLNNTPARTPSRTPKSYSPFTSPESPLSPPLTMSLLCPPDATHTFSVPVVPVVPDVPNVSMTLRPRESSGNLSQKRDLGQRILSQMLNDEIDIMDPEQAAQEILPQASSEESHRPSSSTEKSRNLTSSSANDIPVRASSPTVETLPLLPPPRRPNAPAISDMPSYDVHDDESVENHAVAPGLLQAGTAETLRLSDAYESQVGLSGAFGELTPPPIQDTTTTFTAIEDETLHSRESLTSGSRYSVDDRDDRVFYTPKEHASASTPQTSRPSLSVTTTYRPSSDYSESSPTSSMFRDAFEHNSSRPISSSPSVSNTLGARSRAPSYASVNDRIRNAAFSPPPRVSSSLAHVVLPAPPRHRRTDALPATVGEEDEPSVVNQTTSLMNLTLPGDSFIDFFDEVELQHSGVEDEDGDDETEGEDTDRDESDSDDDAVTVESAISEFRSSSEGMVIVDPLTGSVHNVARDPKQPMGGFTRFGNMSSPQLAAGPSSTGTNFSGTRHRSSSNVPQLPPSAQAWRASEDALTSQAQLSAHRTLVPSRPQTASSRAGERAWTGGKEGLNVQAWQEDQTRQDHAVRRLDGMLLEHIEREKEVMRRITTTMSKNP